MDLSPTSMFNAYAMYCEDASPSSVLYPDSGNVCNSKSDSQTFIDSHTVYFYAKVVNADFDPYLYHEYQQFDLVTTAV